MTQGSNNLHFFYGADGSPAVVMYNGASYGYVKNLQGDIVSIVNSSGAEVVHYTYDAWGKLLSKTGTLATSLGTLNPFRYRGYVYDEETGLYYLRSRYYNPTWGRFVNADISLNSGYALFAHNQFCYCLNSPVIGIDSDGLAPYPGYFHALVQQDFIAKNPGVRSEWGIYKWGNPLLVGRADLINVATGEAWEVKPQMAGYWRDPNGYTERAVGQLESYIFGRVINSENRRSLSASKLQPGGAVPKTQFFDSVTDMDITYWSDGGGIIWNNVKKHHYLNPAPVVVPVHEPAKEKNRLSQPSVGYGWIEAFASLLLGGLYILAGVPAPAPAY